MTSTSTVCLPRRRAAPEKVLLDPVHLLGCRALRQLHHADHRHRCSCCRTDCDTTEQPAACAHPYAPTTVEHPSERPPPSSGSAGRKGAIIMMEAGMPVRQSVSQSAAACWCCSHLLLPVLRLRPEPQAACRSPCPRPALALAPANKQCSSRWMAIGGSSPPPFLCCPRTLSSIHPSTVDAPCGLPLLPPRAGCCPPRPMPSCWAGCWGCAAACCAAACFWACPRG